MDNDNTQDGAEPSPASAGSHGNDPLAVCCHHLANSQAIIERKNEEIERLRLREEEIDAIWRQVGWIKRMLASWPDRDKEGDCLRLDHAALLALLERTK